HAGMTAHTALQPSRPVQDGSAGPPGPTPTPQFTVPERPLMAPDVELVGEFQGSGYADRQWLVRRGDRFLQLSELLYRVAQQATGDHTLADIAARLTESSDWIVGPDQVRQIIAAKLVPLGIIASVEPVAQPRSSGPSPLGVNARIKVIGPSIIEPIARLLQIFF